jgi:hypothetical protein
MKMTFQEIRIIATGNLDLCDWLLHNFSQIVCGLSCSSTLPNGYHWLSMGPKSSNGKIYIFTIGCIVNAPIVFLIYCTLYIFTRWKCIVYYCLCRDGIHFDKTLVSEYKLFKRSNKANLVNSVLKFMINGTTSILKS